MGLGSGCSFHESVEDNDSITDVSVFKMIEDRDGSKNNGYCAVEDDRFSVIEGKGCDILGSVNMRPLETKHEVSPTPSMTKKGVGLKKWKRLGRDANKIGDGGVDAGKMVKRDFLSPDANTSKRLQVCVGAKLKGEDSVSSTDAVVRKVFGWFTLLGDSGLVIEPSFAAGTDSENSEDRSSKSSTAASGQRSWYMTSGMVGFPQDMYSLESSSGRNLMRSVKHGLKVKNQVETAKKARGERVKSERENSHSSMESDSRSSHVLFIQGIYPASNGKPSERLGACDGEHGDKFCGRGKLSNDQLLGGSEGLYEVRYNGKSNDDIVADSSRRCEEDGSENHDSLFESIFALESVQEALEKEILKFREIIHDASNDDSVRNLLPEFEDVSQKLQQATLEQSQHDEGELESLFKQKIEAEVEYLVFSRIGQWLRLDVVDQHLILGHHKAVANEDIASANDTLTLQHGIFKYTLCFFMQLVLLVGIIGVFMFQLSPYHVNDVPT